MGKLKQAVNGQLVDAPFKAVWQVTNGVLTKMLTSIYENIMLYKYESLGSYFPVGFSISGGYPRKDSKHLFVSYYQVTYNSNNTAVHVTRVCKIDIATGTKIKEVNVDTAPAGYSSETAYLSETDDQGNVYCYLLNTYTLIKINSNCDIVWQKSLPEIVGNKSADYIKGICCDRFGNVYVLQHISKSGLYANEVIYKFDPNGNQLAYTSNGYTTSYGTKIFVDSKGGIYHCIANRFTKYQDNGLGYLVEVWTTPYDNSSYMYKPFMWEEGNCLILSGAETINKIDMSTGTISFYCNYPSVGIPGFDIAIDSTGCIYRISDFDPKAGDVRIRKIKPDGTFAYDWCYSYYDSANRKALATSSKYDPALYAVVNDEYFCAILNMNNIQDEYDDDGDYTGKEYVRGYEFMYMFKQY